METAVEYGIRNLGRNIAATTVETVRVTLIRRYKAQLSITAWRGYANILLDRTKYIGSGEPVANMAQVRQAMRDRGYAGDHATL